MIKVKKLVLLITSLLALQASCLMASAADEVTVADPGQKGSISITVKDTNTKKPIPGGTIVLYRIAEVKDIDGLPRYVYTEDFSDCDPLDLSSKGQAEEMAERTIARGIRGTELTLDKNGKAVFGDLEQGVYLIRQKTLSDLDTRINPFYITIPMTIDGKVVYDVDASPKAEVAVKPDTPPDNPPGNPPKNPPSKRIPQTGQLWWPVPVLAVAGMLIAAFGWKRRNSN